MFFLQTRVPLSTQTWSAAYHSITTQPARQMFPTRVTTLNDIFSRAGPALEHTTRGCAFHRDYVHEQI